MSSVYFYYDPDSEFDRLFEDALAARFCPRACAFSAAVPQHRDAYRPR